MSSHPVRRGRGPTDGAFYSTLAFLVFVVLALATLITSNVDAAEPEWTGLTPEVVLDGLNGPIDFAIGPDGSVWWNEYYTGNVTRYDPSDGSREVVFQVAPIEEGVERGMLGLALDPDVVDNGIFYVYYTVADPDDPDGGTNRLSRIADGEETILLTVPAHKLHNGGRILFTPEGTMFVSTGDNDEGMVAQDPGNHLGKILHLHPDGTPAEGNIEGHVYSMGHRNVYGLAYDPATERLFATENNNAERDEVNLITAGGNYGWPICEGSVRYDFRRVEPLDEPCDDPDIILPIGEFYPEGTVAPTGAIILHGHLYWASWNHGEVHRMVEDANGDWHDTIVYKPGHRINDLETDGEVVYYSDWTTIYRLAVPAPPEDLSPITVEGGSEGDGEDGPETGTALPGPAMVVTLATLVVAASLYRNRR